jgi:hypothetical protein
VHYLSNFERRGIQLFIALGQVWLIEKPPRRCLPQQHRQYRRKNVAFFYDDRFSPQNYDWSNAVDVIYENYF